MSTDPLRAAATTLYLAGDANDPGIDNTMTWPEAEHYARKLQEAGLLVQSEEGQTDERNS